MTAQNLGCITEPRPTRPTSLDPSPSDRVAHPALTTAEPAHGRRWQAVFDEQHVLVLGRLPTEAHERVACGEERDLDVATWTSCFDLADDAQIP